MTILVTGGAGYIGSVTVERLRANREDVVVLDDLAYGHREAVDPGVPFYQGKVGDSALLERIAKEHRLELVFISPRWRRWVSRLLSRQNISKIMWLRGLR